MKTVRYFLLFFLSMSALQAVYAVDTNHIAVKRAHDVATMSFVIEPGGQASHTLTSTGSSSEVSKLVYGLNSINQSYIKSNFKGYSGGIGSLSSVNNNVYYFALASVPTVADGLTFYKTAAVTDDVDFDTNHYVHYFDADGHILDATERDDAMLKVAYDKSSMTFVVKAAESCPSCDYTLYFGMIRRHKASGSSSTTFSYSAYFTVNVKVGDTATSVEQVSDDVASDVLYDLTGRRVMHAEHGFFIRNGKKLFFR